MNHQFQVTGMTCGHCVKAVQRAVQTLDEEAQVKIDLTTGQVDIGSAQAREALAAAIREEGYAVQ